MELEQLRERLAAAVRIDDPADAAERLCHACIDLFDVDGAALSLVLEGHSHGTLGASSALSRRVDELQYTFGEGPCFDAVNGGAAVLVKNIADPDEHRWPAVRGAILGEGINAVFALPVSTSVGRIGALDLFRKTTGLLTDADLDGGVLAAEFAALPLVALAGTFANPGDVAPRGTEDPLALLDRVEVYQATGMIIAALGVNADDALARLRAHAFASGMTANEVAWEIVERRLTLDNDQWFRQPGPHGGPH